MASLARTETTTYTAASSSVLTTVDISSLNDAVTTEVPTTINMSTTENESSTILYSKLDANMITVTPLKETKGPLGLMFSNIRYKLNTRSCNTKLCKFQTPRLKLTHYGIPRENSQDLKRDYIKIPEDLDNPKCIELFAKLAEFDAVFSSTEFKTKLFGVDNMNKYNYKSMIYQSSTPSESTSSSFTQQYPRSFIVKLDVDASTKAILSQCFVMHPDKRKELIENLDIDDYAKYIRLNSNICIIAHIKSLWANKPSKTKLDQALNYGVTIKLHQIICEPLPAVITANIISEFIEDTEDIDVTTNIASCFHIGTTNNSLHNSPRLIEHREEQEGSDEPTEETPVGEPST